jgi:tetratricopeptide (TPR) repeat protein
LQQSNELAASRAAFESAYQDFIKQGDLQAAGRVCLELAELSLVTGRVDQVLQWVEKGLNYLNMEMDPVSHSLAHFLLAAGRSQGGGGFAEAELHLKEAVEIARENNLPGRAARSRFEMGNLLAQRGDLPSALEAYRDAVTYAEQAGDTTQVILAHNNFAYHALLAGRLDAAHEHIDQAIGMADTASIQMPRQYLYSTRGEIALADKDWDEAERWFKRGAIEAERAGNTGQMANYTANLGLTAQGRGEYDSALILFESARASVQQLIAPYLLTQIDLWLAELHFLRGERIAAEQMIQRIDERSAAREYHRLRLEVERIRARFKSK